MLEAINHFLPLRKVTYEQLDGTCSKGRMASSGCLNQHSEQLVTSVTIQVQFRVGAGREGGGGKGGREDEEEKKERERRERKRERKGGAE